MAHTPPNKNRTSLSLSTEAIEALRVAYFKDTSEHLSYAAALEKANELWEFTKILMRPVSKEQYRKFHERHPEAHRHQRR